MIFRENSLKCISIKHATKYKLVISKQEFQDRMNLGKLKCLVMIGIMTLDSREGTSIYYTINRAIMDEARIVDKSTLNSMIECSMWCLRHDKCSKSAMKVKDSVVMCYLISEDQNVGIKENIGNVELVSAVDISGKGKSKYCN